MKRSYIILICALLVAVIVWLVERPDRFDVGDFESFILYPNLAGSDLSKIEVEHLISGSRLQKDGNEWFVSEIETEMSRQLKDESIGGRPAADTKYKADVEKISDVLEKLSQLKTLSLVSSNPEKRSVYGVGELAKRVKLFDNSGAILADLLIGKSGTEVFSTYVRINGKDDVFLVESHIGATIPADIMSWRDKTIWDIAPDEIAKISVKRPKENDDSFIIVKDPEDSFWYLGDVGGMELDGKKVGGFVDKIKDLDASRFALVIDQKDTGLSSPTVELTVTTSSGDSKTLLIGSEDKQGYLHARLAGSEEVYLLNSNFTSRIPKDPLALK